MPIYKKYDRKFFKKWSSNMAYILGFLFADGNIIKTKRGTHFVAIYTSDKDLIISIAKCMGSNHKISDRRSESGIVYVMQIGSKELFNDLIKLGLTPHKARRMEFPYIPEKYQGDFIRGYFDGDGNIWSGKVNKNRLNQSRVANVAFTCASLGFLEGLFKVLKNAGLNGGSIFAVKNKDCYRLQYSTIDTLKLHNIMYNKDCNLFLPRKRLIFEEFIKMRP